MVSALALLAGVGIGLVVHKPVNEIFKSFQKSIYLSEKENMLHRKKELQAELEKIESEKVETILNK